MDTPEVEVIDHGQALTLSVKGDSGKGFLSLSMCGLSLLPYNFYNDFYPLPENAIVYEFNRIKAGYGREGKGDGTLLMNKLVELADEKQFYIVGGINPYGALDFKALKAWYEKYGFKVVVNNYMVREPVKH